MMKIRKVLGAGIAGAVSAFCFAAGKSLDVYYTLSLTEADFYVKWLLCSILLSLVIYGIWTFAERKEKINIAAKKIVQKASAFEGRLKGWMIALFLFLMWIPAWLSVFPGAFSYDAYDEWLQINTGNITAHHPVLHVLLLGGLVEKIHGLTGSYNAGIAVYVFLQMAVLAAVFAYTVQFMRERAVSPLWRLFAILFYAFSPVVQLFAICCTKDILFSAAFLLFVISLWRVCVSRETFFARKSWQILFCLSALVSMIMRNNGLYAVVAMLVFLLPLCRRHFGRYFGILAVIGGLYALYVGPFYNMLQVTPGGMQEMLSVPLQQLARVYHYEQETYTAEELQYLHTLIPQENWEQYRSTVADFVKSGFRQEVYKENPARFWRLWWQTGGKKPMTYLNSFLLGIVDYWYPFAVVDGYQDVYGASSYFDYRVGPPGEEQIILPRLHAVYESISVDKDTQKLPGMFLLLSPGWYALIYFQVLMYLWYRKRYRQIVPLLAILLYCATLLLGPIALVRYVLILYYIFPVYCVFLHGKAEHE